MKPIPMNKPVKPQLNCYHLELTKAAVHPQYDYNESLVIVAEDAGDARKQAAGVASGEGKEVWLKPKLSTCRQVNLTRPGVVCIDNLAG